MDHDSDSQHSENPLMLNSMSNNVAMAPNPDPNQQDPTHLPTQNIQRPNSTPLNHQPQIPPFPTTREIQDDGHSTDPIASHNPTRLSDIREHLNNQIAFRRRRLVAAQTELAIMQRHTNNGMVGDTAMMIARTTDDTAVLLGRGEAEVPSTITPIPPIAVPSTAYIQARTEAVQTRIHDLNTGIADLQTRLALESAANANTHAKPQPDSRLIQTTSTPDIDATHPNTGVGAAGEPVHFPDHWRDFYAGPGGFGPLEGREDAQQNGQLSDAQIVYRLFQEVTQSLNRDALNNGHQKDQVVRREALRPDPSYWHRQGIATEPGRGFELDQETERLEARLATLEARFAAEKNIAQGVDASNDHHRRDQAIIDAPVAVEVVHGRRLAIGDLEARIVTRRNMSRTIRLELEKQREQITRQKDNENRAFIENNMIENTETSNYDQEAQVPTTTKVLERTQRTDDRSQRERITVSGHESKRHHEETTRRRQRSNEAKNTGEAKIIAENEDMMFPGLWNNGRLPAGLQAANVAFLADTEDNRAKAIAMMFDNKEQVHAHLQEIRSRVLTRTRDLGAVTTENRPHREKAIAGGSSNSSSATAAHDESQRSIDEDRRRWSLIDDIGQLNEWDTGGDTQASTMGGVVNVAPGDDQNTVPSEHRVSQLAAPFPALDRVVSSSITSPFASAASSLGTQVSDQSLPDGRSLTEKETPVRRDSVNTLRTQAIQGILGDLEVPNRTHRLLDFLRVAPGADPTIGLPEQECTACQDKFPIHAVVPTSCRHIYCQECYQALFRTSLTVGAIFPPRCCRQRITPSSLGRRILASDPKLLQSYDEKIVDFDMPNKTHCSNSICSRLIRPENIIDNRAICSDCSAFTCDLCKAASHDGACPPDHSLDKLLEVAKKKGWQRCYKCRRMVELIVGCYHITCTCGAQFCYSCGGRWGCCDCPQHRRMHGYLPEHGRLELVLGLHLLQEHDQERFRRATISTEARTYERDLLHVPTRVSSLNIPPPRITGATIVNGIRLDATPQDIRVQMLGRAAMLKLVINETEGGGPPQYTLDITAPLQAPRVPEAGRSPHILFNGGTVINGRQLDNISHEGRRRIQTQLQQWQACRTQSRLHGDILAGFTDSNRATQQDPGIIFNYFIDEEGVYHVTLRGGSQSSGGSEEETQRPRAFHLPEVAHGRGSASTRRAKSQHANANGAPSNRNPAIALADNTPSTRATSDNALAGSIFKTAMAYRDEMLSEYELESEVLVVESPPPNGLATFDHSTNDVE